MEINVKINAEERLLNVLERFAMSMELMNNKSVADIVTDTAQLAESEVAVISENKDLTKADDGRPYDQFQEMCDAFDVLINKGRNQDVKDILAKYSTNGEYGGVAPKDWGKAIAMAKEMAKKPKSATATDKKYTLEEVRELARNVQLSKGKETLHQIFQEAGKSKLTDFNASEYASLYQKLLEVM